MSSRLELEKELDLIPPVPYKPTAILRDIHRLFHEATKIDEGVPYSFTSTDDFRRFMEGLKPTKLKQALTLMDDLNNYLEDHLFDATVRSELISKILLRIYTRHHDPGRIEHDF